MPKAVGLSKKASLSAKRGSHCAQLSIKGCYDWPTSGAPQPRRFGVSGRLRVRSIMRN